ncbi:hypothetical protein HG15A2_10240 [Adhaeretor mobilis]|uniref:Uncharacterized protein n=1 Tax=Adhaeretor mobilis TaxID=1930276 RepID=A0A517MSI4_9BACT|nr:hypothetical protein HG15A2_10240 [Adhaeretor mobilis]
MFYAKRWRKPTANYTSNTPPCRREQGEVPREKPELFFPVSQWEYCGEIKGSGIDSVSYTQVQYLGSTDTFSSFRFVLLVLLQGRSVGVRSTRG